MFALAEVFMCVLVTELLLAADSNEVGLTGLMSTGVGRLDRGLRLGIWSLGLLVNAKSGTSGVLTVLVCVGCGVSW